MNLRNEFSGKKNSENRNSSRNQKNHMSECKLVKKLPNPPYQNSIPSPNFYFLSIKVLAPQLKVSHSGVCGGHKPPPTPIEK